MLSVADVIIKYLVSVNPISFINNTKTEASTSKRHECYSAVSHKFNLYLSASKILCLSMLFLYEAWFWQSSDDLKLVAASQMAGASTHTTLEFATVGFLFSCRA